MKDIVLILEVGRGHVTDENLFQASALKDRVVNS